ncbi:extracellular solute-binding protein [Paenibacillus yanchengensis]|uniref:Extracellular solute-binding protein n=1 Tax=Paenibacillus yanchengensis TaxID=2035833 RepID=A0ABW4YHH4_9BACL
MKKVNRNRWGLLTFALVTAISLTACGSGSGNSNEKEQTGAGNGNTTTPTEVIEIVAWDKPHADEPFKAHMDQVHADFEKEYPNIKVTHMEQTRGQEREQLMTAVAGNEQPDIINVSFPSMEVYIQQGIAADVTELWNNYEEKDKYITGALDAATVDGKIYGTPNDMYAAGLYYNKTLFTEAGLDPNSPPTTWDEFVDVAKKIHNPDKGINGFDILGMDWADWHFEYYVWGAGGDLTNRKDNGEVELTFTSDAAVQALQYYKDLKWTHQVTQKNVVQSLDDNQKDFYTGKAAMIIGDSNSYGQFVSKGMDPDSIGFAPLPAGPSGTAPTQVGGSYWIFNPKASPEKLEAAFTYFKYISSKEVMESIFEAKSEFGSVGALSVRSDIDMTKYVEDLPQDIVENIQKAAATPHLEYFLKDRLSPYVVTAIQKILVSSDADPAVELKKAQELAQKEVADPYNASLQ